MEVLRVFLYVLVVLVSLLLIGLILIQPSKSGGMGATFGGIGESAFGGKAGSHLTRATVWMTAIFLVLALALAVLIGRGVGQKKSDFSKSMEAAPAAPAAPATPATPAAPAAPAESPTK